MTAPLETIAVDPAASDRPPDAVRILVVLPTLHPYGGVISVTNAANILVDRGHHVGIVVLGQRPSLPVPLKTGPMFAGAPDEIAERVGTEYDVFVATSWETVDPVVALAEAAGRPEAAFYYVQGFEADLFPEGDPRRQAALETYGRIENRFVKTEFLQSRLAEHGWPAHRIPPGMDLDVFYPRSGPPSTRPRSVVAFARPEAPEDHRGFDVLVEVLQRVSRRDRSAQIGLFGSNEMPRLPFPYRNHGLLPQASLPGVYSAYPVYVDTSRIHGFGRTGVEAMACGTACVLSDSGGIVEYARDGENAVVVPVDAVDETVEAILGLLEDVDRADRLAAAGLATVQAYSDHAAVDAMLGLFTTRVDRA
jgi:hypothetical protein